MHVEVVAVHRPVVEAGAADGAEEAERAVGARLVRLEVTRERVLGLEEAAALLTPVLLHLGRED